MPDIEEVIRLHSPAKINLMLSVHGQREDGYHDLTSLMAGLDFGDEIAVRLSDVDSLECTDPDLPTGPDNLVLQAAALFRRRAGLSSGFSFCLNKRIPVGAGLGGGSGNAATALLAMNRLSGDVLSMDELFDSAKELGSDCPFFIDGKPSLLRGRGEIVKSLPVEISKQLEGQRLLLFKPNFAVSTAWAYGHMRSLRSSDVYEPETVAASRLEGFFDGGALENLLANNFERVVGLKFPAITLILEDLRRMGVPCLLSGSGSCCFALLDQSAASAEEIGACVRDAWGNAVFFIETSICGTKT